MNNQDIQAVSRGKYTSASNAPADALCAGRHLAQANIPEEPTTGDASHGAIIHSALKNQDPSMLTSEQEETYEACNKIAAEQFVKFFERSFDELAGDKMMREQRLWIGWGSSLYHSAQVDLVFFAGDSALVVEYKTLPGEQDDADMNMQLRDQIIIVHNSMKSMGTLTESSRIGGVVVQPLVTHSPTLCEYTVEDMTKAYMELYLRVVTSNSMLSTRTAGAKQCKFCRARHTCPEYQAFAVSIAPNPSRGTGVVSWTPDEMAVFLNNRSVAQKWLDECEDNIKAIMEKNPDAVPGYRLKDGVVRETIVNPEDVHSRFISMGGTSEQFIRAVKISKTDLKEAVKGITKSKGMQLTHNLEDCIGSNSTFTTCAKSIVKIK